MEGTDVNARHKLGWTALMVAAISRNSRYASLGVCPHGVGKALPNRPPAAGEVILSDTERFQKIWAGLGHLIELNPRGLFPLPLPAAGDGGGRLRGAGEVAAELAGVDFGLR